MPTFLLNIGFCATKEQVQSNVAWKQNQNQNFFFQRTRPELDLGYHVLWNWNGTRTGTRGSS
jgi:hypothetical protein